ncbi:MAG: thioredoxin family protein [Bacteroidota bacterium]
MRFTYILLPLCFLLCTELVRGEEIAEDSPLTIIEQDYERARELAAEQEKLLFIDFYTVWCGPCKRLDKYVFQNDSVSSLMGRQVVLLKYDAEQDTTFHLSKKYHVNSYPMGLLLTPEGRVLTRQVGFVGSDAASLGSSVLDFVGEGVELSAQKKWLSGYAPVIDPASYPDFYADYVNRTDTDVDAAEINDYLASVEDKLSEQFVAVLYYFAGKVNDELIAVATDNRETYVERFGEGSFGAFTGLISMMKFDQAVKADDEAAFARAKAFAEEQFGAEEAEEMAASYKVDILQARGEWKKVLAYYQDLKEAGEMDNGYVNYFSWGVYEECDDPEVMATCVAWMRDVVADEPDFDYLDTYARLLHRAEGKSAAEPVIRRAIAAGKAEGRKTGGLEKLLE